MKPSFLFLLVLAAVFEISCSGRIQLPRPGEGPDSAPEESAAPLPFEQLSGTAALDAEESSFIELVNDYRESRGLAPLVVSVRLTRASDWMSQDMARNDYLSHTDSEGRSPFSRMEDFGYFASSAGENVAGGKATALGVFTQWRNSSAHNAAMLDPGYRAIGIARAHDPDSRLRWYWTANFGARVEEE